MAPHTTSATTTALGSYLADLRANVVARHAFDEPSRFRAVLGLDGVVADVNPYRAAGVAVARDDIVGQPIWSIGVYKTDAVWQARWTDRLDRALSSITSTLYEDEFPTDEHGPFGVRGDLSVIRTDMGDPLGFYLEVLNVDIVRETKEELRREILLRKLVFDQSFQLTAILAADGTVLDVNKAVERIGIPREAFLGKRLPELGIAEPNAEERAAEWQRRIDLMQAATEPFRCFDVLPDDAGNLLRAVDCCMTPVRNPDGRLEMILLELRDQTERYAAELRMRASESRFRNLAETLPQMVWTSDGEGVVDYFSPRWTEFTGRPTEELIGRGFWDLVHPDDHAVIEASRGRNHDPETPVIFRMRNAAGDYRWMEARMTVVDDQKGRVHRVGGTLDVTERRVAEEEARRQQEQLRATLELTGYGTYVWYVKEDRFSRSSYQLEEILGLPMADLMEGNAFELFFAAVHPEDREMVQGRVLAAVEPGGPDYEAEFRMVVPERGGGPGTEERWVSAIGRVEFDERSEAIRLVGVFADITNRRHEDDSRLRLQKIEAMGTLASGIAHDFNNVIGAILSYARVAEAELKAGESPGHSIGEIARGALRAGDIVQRMLTFSREEAPRQVAFDLAEVVREAEALVRPTVASSITIDRKLEADLPRIVGDPTQLHQVVVNLLTNAGQAIGEGPGHVEVELVRTSCEEGQLAGGRDGTPVECVRLRVRDDGPGMPAAIAQRVFDPFFTTKGPEKGTGLGLSAVQSIITNHGGTVKVESRLGEGTTFTAYLPVREVPAEPPAPEPVVEPGHELIRILFVDDEEALVRLAHRALPYRGCVVTGFTDPAEALTAFERDRNGFDAMITDLSMPGMTGLQLAEHVRSLRADIPIVLTSGYMRGEEHADAVRRGVDAVVPKPCSIDDLADTVEELIASKASAQ